MAEVSIVDYGIGNTGSICNMFGKLAVPADMVSNQASLAIASRLILPGIGAFDACMSALDLRACGQPFSTSRQRKGRYWEFASVCRC